MRVLSFSLGLLATASLALASACKPRPSSSSSASSASSVISSSSSIQPASVVSASSSVVSSSVVSFVASSSSSLAASSSFAPASSSSSLAPSSSSSAAPVPLPTFNLVAGRSGVPAIDGEQLGVVGNMEPVAFGAPIAAYHLEAGTNYLMSGDLYITWFTISPMVFAMDSSQTGLYWVQIVCSNPALEGVPLSCAPDGYSDVTAFLQFGDAAGQNLFMDGLAHIPTGAVVLDLLPQPVA